MRELRDDAETAEDAVLNRFFLLAPAAIIAVLAAAPASATTFLKAIEDVPLVEGLSETGEPVVFESDFGRVVKTAAAGQVSADAVERFYTETLPALGWKRVDETGVFAFARENERLTISIAEPRSARPVNVTFELVVKLASTRLPE